MSSIPIDLEFETRKLVESLATQYNFTPEKKRIALDEMQSESKNGLPLDIEDLKIKDSSNHQIPVRILSPQNSQWKLPVMIYIHGGGWVSGNARTHDRLIRQLVIGAQMAAVVPEYSLSPEAKYPTALEEIYSVIQWVAEHGIEYNLDSQRLAIAGDNVGGNMAAVMTLIVRERGGPVIHRQLLFYPVMNAAFNTESYHQFAEDYYLRRDEMIWCWDQYTTNEGERNEITASPLKASTEQLRDLPTALIITAEADVLRDEGEAYAAGLRQAGVRVMAVRFQGTIHDFVMLNALAETEAAKGALDLAVNWLRDGLGILA